MEKSIYQIQLTFSEYIKYFHEQMKISEREMIFYVKILIGIQSCNGLVFKPIYERYFIYERISSLNKICKLLTAVERFKNQMVNLKLRISLL